FRPLRAGAHPGGALPGAPTPAAPERERPGRRAPRLGGDAARPPQLREPGGGEDRPTGAPVLLDRGYGGIARGPAGAGVQRGAGRAAHLGDPGAPGSDRPAADGGADALAGGWLRAPRVGENLMRPGFRGTPVRWRRVPWGIRSEPGWCWPLGGSAPVSSG